MSIPKFKTYRQSENSGNSLLNTLTRVVLAIILLIGFMVILGWHLRIRPLVQLVPGTIPMQYNTGLCFILLAASTWIFIKGRGHHFLLIVGSALVIIFSLLNLLQDVTGENFGMDTAFFTPWDLTVTEHPGRMALPTSISFLCSASALIVAVLSRKLFLYFAIGQLITTGLGLTSTSAYLLGFTDLSMFGLGIQMAIHTAIAFVAYGSVMLVYAWYHNPDENGGLRRWGPAITTTLVLSFFICFVITSQNHSRLTRFIELSIGLIISCLIGYAVYRLADFKIAYKGMVLISIPLVFVLLFVAMITRLKTENKEAQNWYLHTKEVITLAEGLSRDLPNAQYVLRSYVMTGNPALATPYYPIAQRTPDTINRLQMLIKDNPQQAAKAQHVGELATTRLAILVDIERLMREGNREQAAEQMKTSYNREVWSEYLRELESFIAEAKRLDSERQLRIEQGWQKLNWLLSIGTMAAIILTAMLVLLFSQSISNRLNVLMENAHSLAKGGTLSPPLAGKDEIADLDGVFHKMAKAVEEANRKERALFDNAQDVICSLDGNGKFVRVNPASLKILGYEPDGLVGRQLIELVSPEEGQSIRQVIESLVKDQAIDSFEACCLHQHGGVVHMLWSATWVAEESLIFCVGRDITERKWAEAKNKQLNTILEQHAAQLQAANKELESFSYSVSHDLRAPLRHIDGFVSLLEKKSAGSLNEDGRRYVRVISESAKQMGNLIDDLLAFSRMGRAEMRKTVVNMQKLVEDVREGLHREVGERKIIWNIASLPEVQADPAMLRLAMTNLLSNAIKYTRPCQVPVIEIGSHNDNSTMLTFYVRDNGVGFDMRYIDKLFGVFQRLHRPDEFEGTGIGLANVRRIINRHGGSTWAEGKIDQGATFFFSLPRLLREFDEHYENGRPAPTAKAEQKG